MATSNVKEGSLEWARQYAEHMKEFGKTHLVFKVPKHSRAYQFGYRYATCEASERQAYQADGAVFVEEGATQP